MFILVKDFVNMMSEMIPARLAEEWDNPGLQVGRNEKEVKVILCALDFSPEVLEQASRILLSHIIPLFSGALNSSPIRTGIQHYCWKQPGRILRCTVPIPIWTAWQAA